mmetsp:Transcript_57646/g.137093  ORF Transcript_57646/g.137093 Transcript_57646/m.137093 type:complete len:94 (+) Transcript_57646:1347-1628(+)
MTPILTWELNEGVSGNRGVGMENDCTGNFGDGAAECAGELTFCGCCCAEAAGKLGFDKDCKQRTCAADTCERESTLKLSLSRSKASVPAELLT